MQLKQILKIDVKNSLSLYERKTKKIKSVGVLYKTITVLMNSSSLSVQLFLSCPFFYIFNKEQN